MDTPAVMYTPSHQPNSRDMINAIWNLLPMTILKSATETV